MPDQQQTTVGATHCFNTVANIPVNFLGPPGKTDLPHGSHSMLVLEVCKANGLQHYYGSGKMASTSCFLL